MAPYSCGPVCFERLKGQLIEYSVQYTHFHLSNYGYSLMDEERVFGMGLLYSWSRLQERLLSFVDLLAACDNAKAGRIRIKGYNWNWNKNDSPDEIEQVLGVFLQLYGTELANRVGRDYTGQQIVYGIQFFFDDILDAYSDALSEGSDHELFDDLEAVTNFRIYDQIFQEIISMNTAINTASKYVDELEQRLNKYQRLFGFID